MDDAAPLREDPCHREGLLHIEFPAVLLALVLGVLLCGHRQLLSAPLPAGGAVWAGGPADHLRAPRIRARAGRSLIHISLVHVYVIRHL